MAVPLSPCYLAQKRISPPAAPSLPRREGVEGQAEVVVARGAEAAALADSGAVLRGLEDCLDLAAHPTREVGFPAPLREGSEGGDALARHPLGHAGLHVPGGGAGPGREGKGMDPGKAGRGGRKRQRKFP